MIYNIGDKSLMFRYLSYNLNNLYDSSIKVDNEYTLDLAKSFYSFLCDVFPKLEFEDNSNIIECDDIAEYYLNKSTIYYKFDSYDENQIPIYDYSVYNIPESVDDIDDNNLRLWPIDDNVLQFIQPGVIVSYDNTVDEIAQAQSMLNIIGYEPEFVGKIDNNFIKYCYNTQNLLSVNNSNILKTGYFDIFVESYLRSL